MNLSTDTHSMPDPVAVLGKATLRTSERLALTQTELGHILGLSRAAVSRARSSGVFPATGKTPELQTLLVRLYRALDSIVGGDDAVAASWLRNPNTELHAIPLDLMKSVAGLVEVLSYLDTRRARV